MPSVPKSKLEIAIGEVLLPSLRGVEAEYRRLYQLRLPEQARAMQDPFEFVRQVDAVQPGLSSRLRSSLEQVQRENNFTLTEVEVRDAAVRACRQHAETSEYYEVTSPQSSPTRKDTPTPPKPRPGLASFLSWGRAERGEKAAKRSLPDRAYQETISAAQETAKRIGDVNVLRAYQSAYREALFNGVSLILMVDPEVRRFLVPQDLSEVHVRDDYLRQKIQLELTLAARESSSQILSVDESTKKYESFLKMQWMTAMGAIASSLEALDWSVSYDFFQRKVQEFKDFIAEQIYDRHMGLVLSDVTINRLAQQFKPRLLQHGLEVIEDIITSIESSHLTRVSADGPYTGRKTTSVPRHAAPTIEEKPDRCSARTKEGLPPVRMDMDMGNEGIHSPPPSASRSSVLGSMEDLAAVSADQPAAWEKETKRGVEGEHVVPPATRRRESPPRNTLTPAPVPVLKESIRSARTQEATFALYQRSSLRSPPTREDKVLITGYELKLPRTVMENVGTLYQRLEEAGISPENAEGVITKMIEFGNRIAYLQKPTQGTKAMSLEDAVARTRDGFTVLWSRMYGEKASPLLTLAQKYLQQEELLAQAKSVAQRIAASMQPSTVDYFRKIEGLPEDLASRLSAYAGKVHQPSLKISESEAEDIVSETIAAAESLKLAAGVNGGFNPTAYATLIRALFHRFRPRQHSSPLEKAWSEAYYQYNARFTELGKLGDGRSAAENEELKTISYLRNELETIYREYAELRARASPRGTPLST